MMVLAALGAIACCAILEPGVTVARDLGPGETATFQVALAAGDFLEVAVEQQGVDVSITVGDPDGAAILEVDHALDPLWLERVLWIARATGVHSLTFRAKGDRPGAITIRLVAPRPLEPGDERRVAAERDFEHVLRLARDNFKARNPQELPETRRRLASAREGFRAVGDRRGEALVLGLTTDLELRLDRAREAVTTGQQALAIFHELHDRTGQAWVVYRIGWAQVLLAETGPALDSLHECQRLSREASNEWMESTCLRWIGFVGLVGGDSERAIDWLAEGLEKSRRSGNRITEAWTLHDLGNAYAQLGEEDKALSSYEQALAVFLAEKDHWREVMVGDSIAHVYAERGDYGRARDLHLRYLTYFQKAHPGGSDEAHGCRRSRPPWPIGGATTGRRWSTRGARSRSAGRSTTSSARATPSMRWRKASTRSDGARRRSRRCAKRCGSGASSASGWRRPRPCCRSPSSSGTAAISARRSARPGPPST